MEDDQPCWMSVSDLYDEHPRAVGAYIEENNLNDIDLLSPPPKDREPSISEEDVCDIDNENKNDGGEENDLPSTRENDVQEEYEIQNDTDLNTVEDDNKDDYDDDDDDETSCGGDDDEYELEHQEIYSNDPAFNYDIENSGPPSLMVRRSTRQRNPPDRLTMLAHAANTSNFSWTPQIITANMQFAYQVEVENSIDTTKIDPDSVLPAPNNWKQIMQLPVQIKQLWIASFVKELKELLRKGTVSHETPNDDDPIIPVTAKHRVKLNADGSIEKLKTRIALRGDLMRETSSFPILGVPLRDSVPSRFSSHLPPNTSNASINWTTSQLFFKQMYSDESLLSFPRNGKNYLPITLTYTNG